MIYININVRYTQFELSEKFNISSREIVKRMRVISKDMGIDFIKDNSMGCHYSYPLIFKLAEELEVNYIEISCSKYIHNTIELPF